MSQFKIDNIPAYSTKNAVPWALMDYDDVVKYGFLDQIRAHCENNLSGQNRIDYCKFLHFQAKFPREIASRLCGDGPRNAM